MGYFETMMMVVLALCVGAIVAILLTLIGMALDPSDRRTVS